MLERMWRKGNFCTLLVRNMNWCSHYGEQCGGPAKKKKKIIEPLSSNFTPGHILKKKKQPMNLKSYIILPNVHSSIIYSSQGMEV